MENYFKKIKRMVDELEYLCYKFEFSPNIALSNAIWKKKKEINRLIEKATIIYGSLKIHPRDLEFLRENGILFK